jgi:O-antigen/teichoic acid export membrane protein
MTGEHTVTPPRPLAGGAAMNAGSQVVVAATAAVSTIVVARLFGPDGTGRYAVALTLFTMLFVLGSLGLESGITYLVSARRWSPRSAFVQSQLAALVLGVAGMAVGIAAKLVFGSALEGLSTWLVVVVVGGLPLSLAWFFASRVALATDQYEAYVVPPAAQSALVMVGVAVLGAVYGVEGAIVALTVSQVIVAAGTLAWVARRVTPRREPERDRPHGRARFAELAEATRFGLKAYTANALQFVNYRLDILILNAVASQEKVGQYSVAVSVTITLWLLPRALSAVVLPRVASLSSGPNEEYRALVETKSVRHVALICAACAVGVAGVLVGLVTLLYGADFHSSIGLGLILLPGATLIGVAGVLSATILGRGFPIYSVYTMLIMTPLTVAAYVTLVPSLEAVGAALASTASYTGTFLLTAHFFRRATGHRVAPLLVPTRSELDDYRALLRAIRARRGGSP